MRHINLIRPLNSLIFKLNNELTEGIPIGHLYNLRIKFDNPRGMFEYSDFSNRMSNTNDYLSMAIKSFYNINYRRIINGEFNSTYINVQ